MKDIKYIHLQDLIATGLLDALECVGAVSSGYNTDGCYHVGYHSREMTVEEVEHLYDYARYITKSVGIDIKLCDLDED